MFKLNAQPTFKAKVDIPIPGGTTEPLLVEFRSRTRSELAAWTSADETKGKDDAAWLMGIVVGWSDADEPFSEKALRKLCENYLGASFAIRDTYLRELSGNRLGN
jgi:hypothetical protein